MIVKIDEDGQIKLPEAMMERIKVSPGDELEVSAGPSWLTVSRRREYPLPQQPTPRKKIDLSRLEAFHERLSLDPNITGMEDLDETGEQGKIDLSKVEAFRARIAADPKYAEMEDLDEVRKHMYYGNPLRD